MTVLKQELSGSEKILDGEDVDSITVYSGHYIESSGAELYPLYFSVNVSNEQHLWKLKTNLLYYHVLLEEQVPK